VQIRIVSSIGVEYASACQQVAGRFTTIQDLVASSEVITLLEDTRARKDVVIEFRAFHDFDQQPCTNFLESDLMLWGSSAPTDLTDPTLQGVTIQFECRPGCDCEAFDEKPIACPADIVPGICTPAEQLLCRKACETDDGCYGGLLGCRDSVCAATEGGTCDQCTKASDCDSGICVTNSNTSESFCADRCPSFDVASACPVRMSCKVVDGVIFQTLP